jgi:hypothetical protein
MGIPADVLEWLLEPDNGRYGIWLWQTFVWKSSVRK